MKKCSREKVLIGEKSKDDPPNPSRWTGGPGGQQDQGHGVVLHDQGEEYQQPRTPRSGSSKVPQEEKYARKARQAADVGIAKGDLLLFVNGRSFEGLSGTHLCKCAWKSTRPFLRNLDF